MSEDIAVAEEFEGETGLVSRDEDPLNEGDGSIDFLLTDPKAEEAGVEFADVNTGAVFIVAHGENRKYRDYLQYLIQPRIQLIQSRTARGYAVLRRFEAQAMAKFVLLGWRNLKIGGQEIPYSEEKAFEFLHDGKWRKLRHLIDSFATDDEAFGPSRESLGKG